MNQPLYQAADVLDMAVQIEQAGLAFYRGCAASRAGENLKELFGLLAKQEVGHTAVFTAMKEGLPHYELKESFPGEAQEYVEALISDRVFPTESDAACAGEQVSDGFEAIDLALRMEKQSILFYSGIRDLVRSSEQDVMDRVIAEERSHIRKLLAVRRELEAGQKS